MATSDIDTLLVTGASGHLGQRVLHHLVNTLGVPAGRIIATTRKPATLADWAAKGVVVRASDFDDPASLVAAFEGAARVLLISTDTIGRRVAQHQAAIDAAVKVGATHVIYTSMPTPDKSLVLFAPDHAGTEAALAASALPGWTVLRNNWYFETLFLSIPSVLASGKWFTAAGDGRTASIARDDIARAAAAALAGAERGKVTYTLSGAKARTNAEIAALVSQAVGKPIEVIPVTGEDLVQGMVAHGVPEVMARVVASFDANTAAGQLADVTGDFKTLTGVEPQSLEEWLASPSNQRGLIGNKAA
jgi:NAD(P)H dehydrogenase (quinone)